MAYKFGGSPYRYTFSTEYHRPYVDTEGVLTQEFRTYEEKRIERCERIIDEYSVEKNDIFVAEEDKARKYIESLGFSADAPVFLVNDDPDDLLQIRTEVPSCHAWVESDVRSVFVRQSRLLETDMYTNPATIGRLLVHEFAHATHHPDRIHMHFDAPESEVLSADPRIMMRNVFTVMKGDRYEGFFYEEGFADYIAGRYYRSLRGDERAIGITSEDIPKEGLPEHFRQVDPDKIPGPDGYAMELIAYELERRNIMDADTFVAMLIETRREDTKIGALRAFAQAVNVLEPGLYRYLQALRFGNRQDWIDGCNRVRQIVLKNL